VAELKVSLLNGFAPLDAQFAADEKLSLPASLAKRWQGRKAVHVLIDGALIVNLAERLEAAHVPHECLFDGDLTEFAGAAPWLATLSTDSKLMRALFTNEGPLHLALWDNAATLFIETDLSLEAVRKHLRRFLRVADAAGQMHFFRFWEASTCAAYFRSLGTDPDLTQRWFCPREGGQISAFLVPDKPSAGLAVIELVEFDPNPEPALGAFTLRDVDHAAMAHARLAVDLAAMVTLLVATFPEKFNKADPDETDAFAKRTLSRMREYGFWQKDHLFMLLAWELHYGPHFEHRDPDGHLRDICKSPLPEGEKFALLQERVATFE
jgi:hypothetical protein